MEGLFVIKGQSQEWDLNSPVGSFHDDRGNIGHTFSITWFFNKVCNFSDNNSLLAKGRQRNVSFSPYFIRNLVQYKVRILTAVGD